MLDALEKALQKHPELDDLTRVEDAWLIHFTNLADAHTIATRGFCQGTSLEGELNHCFGKNSRGPGVNFAFLTADDYAIMTLAGMAFGSTPEAAVVFKASVVRMLHADGFHQCAFWGPDALGPFHVLSVIHPDPSKEPHEQEWSCPSQGASGPLFEVLDAIEQAPSLAKSPKKVRP